MSYMLEFPPAGPPPLNIHSPPYVLFGIQGHDVFSNLPEKIPLAMVLHFVPKMAEWVLPVPEDLPPAAVRLALRTPYVGINILKDMDVVGLKWIIHRMMLQVADLPQPKENFCLGPQKHMTSISIHRAWIALELPPAGLQSLHAHMLMHLMCGPPVMLAEMKAIWASFDHKSDIVREMGLNFIRCHLEYGYPSHIFKEIQHWKLDTRERTKFFRALEVFYPEFSDLESMTLEAMAMRKQTVNSGNNAAAAPTKIQTAILEKTGTKIVTPRGKMERERDDGVAMRRRLSRTRSNDGIRSVETAILGPTPMPSPSASPKLHSSENILKVVNEALTELRLKDEKKGDAGGAGGEGNTDDGNEESDEVILLQPISYQPNPCN